jgi:hypothetical protein
VTGTCTARCQVSRSAPAQADVTPTYSSNHLYRAGPARSGEWPGDSDAQRFAGPGSRRRRARCWWVVNWFHRDGAVISARCSGARSLTLGSPKAMSLQAHSLCRTRSYPV